MVVLDCTGVEQAENDVKQIINMYKIGIMQTVFLIAIPPEISKNLDRIFSGNARLLLGTAHFPRQKASGGGLVIPLIFFRLQCHSRESMQFAAPHRGFELIVRRSIFTVCVSYQPITVKSIFFVPACNEERQGAFPP